MNFQIICILFILFIPFNSWGYETTGTKENQISVPPLALSWGAKVHLVNFNPSQERKIKAALKMIKNIISSPEFKERIINYQYKGKKGFIDNKGLSNEEIYRMILEGAEERSGIRKDNTMDVELELYFQEAKTIGYTYPDTDRIWINKKYFAQYTPIKVADNLMHEWMHKLGFSHSSKWSEDREHSVPYAVGYLIEELANKP
jgi:hypothetical protein